MECGGTMPLLECGDMMPLFGVRSLGCACGVMPPHSIKKQRSRGCALHKIPFQNSTAEAAHSIDALHNRHPTLKIIRHLKPVCLAIFHFFPPCRRGVFGKPPRRTPAIIPCILGHAVMCRIVVDIIQTG